MLTLVQPKSIMTTPVAKFERVLESQISGRAQGWTEQVIAALRNLESSLRLHMAEMEGRQGLFPSLIRPRSDTLPTITRQVGRLRREHHDLLERVQELHQLAEGVLNSLLPP